VTGAETTVDELLVVKNNTVRCNFQLSGRGKWLVTSKPIFQVDFHWCMQNLKPRPSPATSIPGLLGLLQNVSFLHPVAFVIKQVIDAGQAFLSACLWLTVQQCMSCSCLHDAKHQHAVNV